jgi:YgiT-type zinc finger domain-containing protein
MKSPCSECGGKLTKRTVTQEFEREGVRLKLSGFKAWVCSKCGEIYFEPGGAERVARAVECLFSLAFAEQRHKGKVSAQLSAR